MLPFVAIVHHFHGNTHDLKLKRVFAVGQNSAGSRAGYEFVGAILVAGAYLWSCSIAFSRACAMLETYHCVCRAPGRLMLLRRLILLRFSSASIITSSSCFNKYLTFIYRTIASKFQKIGVAGQM